MAANVDADLSVKRFRFEQDDKGRRLIFPQGITRDISGRAGTMNFGAAEAMLDGLEGRLNTIRWTADSASFGGAWLKDDAGRIEMSCERIEMSRGAMLTRADAGVEIVAPHVSLQEVKITVKGPFERSHPAPTPAQPAAPKALRQESLRFLDSLSGKLDFTVKVKLDLPVIGERTLDQSLKIPVNEGSLNYSKLEDSLDWLEGRFLDFKHEGPKLSLTWKVPIVGREREIIAWELDPVAQNLASLGSVPVRSLADFRTRTSSKPAEPSKNKVVQSLALEAIDIALSLIAPRSFEVGGGLIMFGGDDSPGMVDLKVKGAINDKQPGSLKGEIGSIDTTIKDVRMGTATLTSDRLHFDDLDELHVVFDGFRPTCVTMVVHRVTATNLNLILGKR